MDDNIRTYIVTHFIDLALYHIHENHYLSLDPINKKPPKYALKDILRGKEFIIDHLHYRHKIH